MTIVFIVVNSASFQLLVVDDDMLIHQAIRQSVPSCWRTLHARKMSEIPERSLIHAAMVDMHLEIKNPQPLGLEVIKKLSLSHPQCEIVAMSGDLDRQLMEKCLHAGAQRYLAKPLSFEELSLVLGKIEALWRLRSFDLRSQSFKARWIGTSEASQSVLKQVAALKGEENAVLIEGETGTGKEVIASLLHQQEGTRPLVSINIAAIPENLFESELFGHVKGAFTGADQNKMGLVEAANSGDLFLDEIEALPTSQQVKLLRFLESGEFRRVGSKEISYAQARVIVASNIPLKKLVEENKFRDDLYFRLASHRIVIAPLRERTEDLEALAQYFIETSRPKRFKTLGADAIAELKQYQWPGNVRELKRIIEQLLLASPLPVIRAEDVRRLIGESGTLQSSSSVPDFSLGLTKLMADYEAAILRAVIGQTSSIDEAANQLQISRSNMYKKIKDYEISEEKQ